MMDFVGDKPKDVDGNFFGGQLRAEHFHIKAGRSRKSFRSNEKVGFRNYSSSSLLTHVFVLV